MEAAKREAATKYSRRVRRPRTTHALDSDPRVNVVGVGIGAKIRGERVLKRIVLHVYVAHKLDPALVPRRHLVPERIGGIETDVIETGRFLAAATSQVRPARPGCSVGATQGSQSTFGTFGVLVSTGKPHNLYLLSCSHVLSNWGTFKPGTPILQQANRDGGSMPADRLGFLATAYPLDADLPNEIDAAIASVDPSLVDARILDPIGPLASAVPIGALESMRVEKVGRSTNHTVGRVIATSSDFDVDSGDPDIGSFPLRNQILVRGTDGPFAELGDSGALIVDSATKRATGLLSAISDSTTISAASHMQTVLTLMGLSIVTQ